MIGQYCILAVGANAILAITGYIFSTEHYFGFPVYVPAIGMAINTSVSFILLALALLFSRPKSGMASLLTSETQSGEIGRHILLTAIISPPLVGTATRLGFAMGWYDALSQASLFVVIVVGLIMRSTWAASKHAEKEELRAAAALSETKIINQKLQETVDKLNHSQERLDLALQGAELGSWDWDIKTGKVEFSSRWAEMRGYRLDEIKPHVEFWTSGIHPDDLPRVQKTLDDYFHGRVTGYESEFRILTKSGEWKWILDRGKVFERDPAGNPTRMVGIELDITERKRYESQLQKAIKSREDILAIVSHDLKNPVSSISLTAQMLGRSRDIDIQHLHKFAERIQRSTTQMQQLIRDLLDFAKLESGTFSLDIYAEKFSEVLGPIIDGFRIQAEARNQILKVNIPEDLPMIACDSARLGQVISNLLANAIKFSPEGGSIAVSVQKQEIAVVISVSDTGSGIPSEQLSKIFDRYWQAEEAKNLGSGLGLAIAKGIVESQGGRIWVESEIGRGSTFNFTVPFASPETKKKQVMGLQSPKTTVIGADSLRGIHVLIVDDSPDILLLLRRLLESVGAMVTEACSVQEALKKLTAVRPDVLLTDIEMPGEGGFDLIKKVRGLTTEQGRDTPFVALTAHEREEELRKIEAAGFDMKLSKPINFKKTVAAVRELVSHVRELH